MQPPLYRIQNYLEYYILKNSFPFFTPYNQEEIREIFEGVPQLAPYLEWLDREEFYENSPWVDSICLPTVERLLDHLPPIETHPDLPIRIPYGEVNPLMDHRCYYLPRSVVIPVENYVNRMLRAFEDEWNAEPPEIQLIHVLNAIAQLPEMSSNLRGPPDVTHNILLEFRDLILALATRCTYTEFRWGYWNSNPIIQRVKLIFQFETRVFTFITEMGDFLDRQCLPFCPPNHNLSAIKDINYDYFLFDPDFIDHIRQQLPPKNSEAIKQDLSSRKKKCHYCSQMGWESFHSVEINHATVYFCDECWEFFHPKSHQN